MYVCIYLSSHTVSIHLCRYEFSDCHFQNNSAAFGGALSTVQVYSQVKCYALHASSTPHHAFHTCIYYHQLPLFILIYVCQLPLYRFTCESAVIKHYLFMSFRQASNSWVPQTCLFLPNHVFLPLPSGLLSSSTITSQQYMKHMLLSNFCLYLLVDLFVHLARYIVPFLETKCMYMYASIHVPLYTLHIPLPHHTLLPFLSMQDPHTPPSPTRTNTWHI